MQDYSRTMVAQFGWRHVLAAWSIVIVIAAMVLGTFGLLRAFDIEQADPASRGLTNPRHDSAAHNPPTNVIDPFYGGEQRTGQH